MMVDDGVAVSEIVFLVHDELVGAYVHVHFGQELEDVLLQHKSLHVLCLQNNRIIRYLTPSEPPNLTLDLVNLANYTIFQRKHSLNLVHILFDFREAHVTFFALFYA